MAKWVVCRWESQQNHCCCCSVISNSLPTPWTAAHQASLPFTNLLELTQTHVHWVGDAIQPSHPLSAASPRVFNLSQHEGLFQWVGSSLQVAKSIGVSASASILPMNIQSWFPLGRMDWLDLLAVQETPKSLLQHHSSKASLLQHSVFVNGPALFSCSFSNSVPHLGSLILSTPFSSSAYSLENGFPEAFLFAFCPSFGMVHDGEGNPCRKTEGSIMSPTLTGSNGVFSWSSCSRQYLKKFLR